MVDYSFSTFDKLPESKVSQSLTFCFDNAFQENSCFIVDLFCLLNLQIAMFLNGTRRDRNLPLFTLKGKE